MFSLLLPLFFYYKFLLLLLLLLLILNFPFRKNKPQCIVQHQCFQEIDAKKKRFVKDVRFVSYENWIPIKSFSWDEKEEEDLIVGERILCIIFLSFSLPFLLLPFCVCLLWWILIEIRWIKRKRKNVNEWSSWRAIIYWPDDFFLFLLYTCKWHSNASRQ